MAAIHWYVPSLKLNITFSHLKMEWLGMVGIRMSFWGLFPIFRGELAVSLFFFFQDVGAEGPFVACDGTLASPLGIRCFFFFLGGGFPYQKPG